MKKIILVTILTFCLAFVSACTGGAENSSSSAGDSGEPIVLKLGTKMPPNSAEGKAFQYFADLVKKKSDGDLVVEVYPSEQLGKGTTQIDNMLRGTQAMYAEGSTYLSDFDKRFNVASLPYLFDDYEHFRSFWTGPIGKEINQNLIEQGIRILNTERNFRRGPYRVLLSTRPVKSLEDLQGLRLRAFQSDVYIDAYKKLGANPIVVAWTETYLALKQNTVEAVTSPISLVWDMKFSEVAPYMTVIDEYPQDIVIAMSEKIFQDLSDEHQKILIEAANEAGVKGSQIAKKTAEKAIKKMKEEHNLKIFDDINKAKWREKLVPFYHQLEEDGRLPEGLIEKINSM